MKRYDQTYGSEADGRAMEEAAEGEWVRFDDVAPLVAALREIDKGGCDPWNAARQALVSLEGGGK